MATRTVADLHRNGVQFVAGGAARIRLEMLKASNVGLARIFVTYLGHGAEQHGASSSVMDIDEGEL